ncbi:MAG: hypothetical protein ACLPN1_02165 [Dissulfurispiraceae bacterium]
MRLSSILKQITVINCILLVCIVTFVYFVLIPIFTVEVRIPPAASASVNTAELTKEKAVEQGVNPSVQEYAVIAEKNLFHPDRIIPAEKKAETVVRPEFVLYGTLISDSVSIAYISDSKAPRSTAGRGKRQVGLKLGEALSGYTLKEVLPDRAVMVRGDDRIELKVISPESKKERGVTVGGPGGVAAQPAVPSAAMTPHAPTGQVPSASIPPRAPTRQVMPTARPGAGFQSP